MMGTLATVLAGKEIQTTEDLYWAEVEGAIEKVNEIPKITEIRVTYHLKLQPPKKTGAQEAFSNYLTRCPAAQSVLGCIQIKDELRVYDLEPL